MWEDRASNQVLVTTVRRVTSGRLGVCSSGQGGKGYGTEERRARSLAQGSKGRRSSKNG
jgi:hypothetical protein